MENQPYVKTGESEIDYLVVEELFSSSKFQKWLLNRLNINNHFEFIGAWKSFNGRYGECDVAIKFKLENKIIIILIENKIYSSEQPNQAQRYYKTGKDLIENTDVDNFITCLLCPKIYFKEDAPMNTYEFQIFYEELFDFFNSDGNEKDNRISFKKIVIQNGIDRARTKYQRFTDENTNRFYEFYEENARNKFPELEYKKPKEVASGNYWIRFNPKIFPAKTTIVHKAKEGYVDLQIPNYNILEFSNKYKYKLNQNMSVHKTGKSISIRIMTTKIPILEEIEDPNEFIDEIIESLSKANQLLQWFKENKIT